MNPIEGIPARLLLATDLCAGCDRPLDRARQLAQEWHAALTVLMVREGPDTPDEVGAWLDGGSVGHAVELAARAELAEEFSGSGLVVQLRLAQGDVTDAIAHAAEALPDALVVIGASREESFRHLLLGSTAGRLARSLPQPVLLVRKRTRGPYARILVANDFSDPARQALVDTLRLFPGRAVTLFHALEDRPHMPQEAFAGSRLQALEDSERFLDGCALAPGERRRVRIVIESGALADTLAHYVAEHALQLVVLGLRGNPLRSTVARVLLGSRGEDLLRQLPCDTLLVHAPERMD